MRHILTSMVTASAALALSVAAFAGGGMRANGSGQTASAHEQASVHMQSPMIRSTTSERITVQSNNRTRVAGSATAHTTGQPNASCEDNPNTPGHAASAPGSAFNPEGRAGSVYAGEQPQNSRNPVSVSQYDAACLHQR